VKRDAGCPQGKLNPMRRRHSSTLAREHLRHSTPNTRALSLLFFGQPAGSMAELLASNSGGSSNRKLAISLDSGDGDGPKPLIMSASAPRSHTGSQRIDPKPQATNNISADPSGPLQPRYVSSSSTLPGVPVSSPTPACASDPGASESSHDGPGAARSGGAASNARSDSDSHSGVHSQFVVRIDDSNARHSNDQHFEATLSVSISRADGGEMKVSSELKMSSPPSQSRSAIENLSPKVAARELSAPASASSVLVNQKGDLPMLQPPANFQKSDPPARAKNEPATPLPRVAHPFGVAADDEDEEEAISLARARRRFSVDGGSTIRPPSPPRLGSKTVVPEGKGDGAGDSADTAPAPAEDDGNDIMSEEAEEAATLASARRRFSVDRGGGMMRPRSPQIRKKQSAPPAAEDDDQESELRATRFGLNETINTIRSGLPAAVILGSVSASPVQGAASSSSASPPGAISRPPSMVRAPSFGFKRQSSVPMSRDTFLAGIAAQAAAANTPAGSVDDSSVSAKETTAHVAFGESTAISAPRFAMRRQSTLLGTSTQSEAGPALSQLLLPVAPRKPLKGILKNPLNSASIASGIKRQATLTKDTMSPKAGVAFPLMRRQTTRRMQFADEMGLPLEERRLYLKSKAARWWHYVLCCFAPPEASLAADQWSADGSSIGGGSGGGGGGDGSKPTQASPASAPTPDAPAEAWSAAAVVPSAGGGGGV
jgi:hypothetical protein